MADELTLLVLVHGADLHDGERAEITRQLYALVRDRSDASDVRMVSAGAPPSGAKAGEAFELGKLMVTVAPVVLAGVVDVLTSWLRRRPEPILDVTIGGHRLSGAVTAEQREAIVAALVKAVSSEGQP